MPPAAKRPTVIFLMGPTASGKTDLAVSLLDHLNAEIISVDSALVYRGMDIGSAKPDAELLARVPHHLIDIRDPAEPYSAADFVSDARPLIRRITEAGRVPLLVGGTMLYFKALLDGLADLPASDPDVRRTILAKAAQCGWPALHAELAAVDPVMAAKLHPNHSQRIQRALEVYRITGRPMSQLQRDQDGAGSLADDYQVRQLALIPHQRRLLHQRIEERFLKMLELGFVDEVNRLFLRRDLNDALPSIRAVGYRQVWGFLAGDYGFDEMVARGIAATRQLAKRQLTWLRKWPGLNVVPIDTVAGEVLGGDEMTTQCLKILRNSPIY
ncbi:MAG: tRNA (adenosine(37)-N6)-dimethylallyltransferase MiaA [Porticoccaceae bacterium]|nr:tRNA (adenosine(37)-N6)-dimethylallyltransferase MiaA [Porticoccaceae bacterium]